MNTSSTSKALHIIAGKTRERLLALPNVGVFCISWRCTSNVDSQEAITEVMELSERKYRALVGC